MFLHNKHNNSKCLSMLWIKIALAFVMFIVVINRGLVSNLINNIQKIFHSPEILILDTMNFSRVAIFEHIISMGIGCVLLEILKYIMITIALIALVVFIIKENLILLKNKSNFIEKNNIIADKNIYLLTNKFIC